MFRKMPPRRASHSGSWYTKNAFDLNKELGDWLNAADLSHGPARAIISPHAGYSYCGACAAYAYRQISPVAVRKIFILGPSHHGASRCSLTLATTYKTPLYDLKIDAQVCQELIYTEKFNWLSMDKDEEEHSIEMQLPYIAKVMEGYQDSFTIIPILIGSLTPAEEAEYGKILAPYMANPQNLFVISSDFCHWGQRFRYTYYDKSYGPIYNSIKNLDQMGMDIIEKLTPSLFTEYLKKYENTICGRHPIGILLQTIQSIKNSGNAQRMTLKFLKYAQSSQCNNMNDSSVSYASASLVIE